MCHEDDAIMHEVAIMHESALCKQVHYYLDERLQRVKPLCYPPANLIRGQLSFYWSSERHSELSPPRKECK